MPENLKKTPKKTSKKKSSPTKTKTHDTLALVEPGRGATPIWVVPAVEFPRWLRRQPVGVAKWLTRHRYQAKPGRFITVPGPGVARSGGALLGVVLTVAAPATLWNFAGLTLALPAGRYRVEGAVGALDAAAATTAALGWAYGGYRFTRYRKAAAGEGGAALEWPAGADRSYVARTVRGASLMRNLVNTPAGDLGPADLAEVALSLAADLGATANVIVGHELLARGYPMVHAVGRAGRQEPRLVDLRWGDKGPRVTLVGKGVCFDSGGLDIKSADGMLLMKKDMAGAAVCLGLMHMIVDAGLPLRLRVLLPLVENAISSDAYHPGDVLTSRQGLTVEIGNTDAEGRLILADALAEADRERPDLLVDFSTLTGAARVALGPDLPAMYANDDAVAAELLAIGAEEADPVWRMPLWAPYAEMLDSKIADINNTALSSFAGSITAALFLQRFVERSPRWVHLDLYAWSPKSRPGRPEGAEPQTMRAVYRLIERRATAKVVKAKAKK